MSHRPRVVPSKNALRALRALAFSYQTAFVGAVGSACGLFAIQCHQRQKIQLAERVLETKRTIHVLSKGRGKVQAARMFDAAEKGEDFTLHHGRPRKARRSRKYFTAAAAAKHVDDDTWLKHMSQNDDGQLSIQDGDQSSSTASNSKDGPNSSRKPSQSTRRSWPLAAANDQRTVFNPISASSTVPPIRQINSLFTASRYKVNSQGTYNSRVAVAQLKQQLQEKWQYPIQEYKIPDSDTNTAQTSTDLHPIPPRDLPILDSALAESGSTLSTEESVFFNFVFGKSSPDTIFESRIFDKTQFGPRDDSSADGSLIEKTSQSLVDDFMPFSWTGDTTSGAPYIGQPSCEEDARTIRAINLDEGVKAALEKLEQVLNSYALIVHEHSYLLRSLLSLLKDVFSNDQVSPIILKVVRRFLASDNYAPDIILFLYPSIREPDDIPNDYNDFSRVRMYMHVYCQMFYDHDTKIDEMRKIYEASQRLGIPCNEDAMIPVLRSLIKDGRQTQAHKLFERMQTKYNVQCTTFSTVEIMRGITSTGNFPQANAMLGALHAEGISRQKPYAVSEMFAGVVEHYANHYSPEKVFSYVVHCINEYGVIPTNAVSARLIQMCLQARRYDLARGWVIRMQREFPNVEIGLATHRFATSMSAVWKDMKASCEDVFDSVKALSAFAIRDPYTNAFRGVVSEAVDRDLFARIKALEALGSYKISQKYEKPSTVDMQLLLTDVKILIVRLKSDGLTPRTRLMSNDLIRQIKAVIELNELLSGSHAFQLDEALHPPLSPVLDTGNSKAQPIVPNNLSNRLRGARLPSNTTIIHLIEQDYRDQEKKQIAQTRKQQRSQKLGRLEQYEKQRHQTWSHENLRYVIDRLAKLNRQGDACDIFTTIFTSAWANPANPGRGFTTDVFTTWLRLVIEIRSTARFREVLWHILDSGPEVRLTSELLLLARYGAAKTHNSRFRQATDSQLLEIEYLCARLRLRRNLQRDKSLIFAKWDGLKNTKVNRWNATDGHLV